MKKYKIFLGIASIVATGLVLSTALTSCSGVSQDILDNMVGRGDGSKFSDHVTLEQEIKTALTDKNSTDAFKKTVVNKLLFNWYKSLIVKDNKFDTQAKQWQKDIDSDYDSQVQSYKDSHSSNWQYYFQNEVLNPVGGYKGKSDGTTNNSWYQSKWEEKIRSYFTDEMTKIDYLSVPDPTQFGTTGPEAISGIQEKNGNSNTAHPGQIEDLDLPIVSTINASGTDFLGNGSFTGSDLLNPDWWPSYNFYATANPNFNDHDSSTSSLDFSWALLQREAFSDYTLVNNPISTGMVLWKYTLRAEKNETDLKKIYNASVITGKNGDAGLLDKPCYQFPFFGETGTMAYGPNEKFANFVRDFNTAGARPFMTDRGTTNVGLMNIPSGMTYGDDSSNVFLINQSTSVSNSFETYTGPVLDMYHAYENNPSGSGKVEVGGNEIMVANNFSDPTKSSQTQILPNFLFADGQDTSGGIIKPLPASYSASSNGIIDLHNIYGETIDENDHSSIFYSGPDSDSPLLHTRYALNAIRLKNISGDYLPYIMIRNDSGVHVEGIDGLDYLKTDKVIPPAGTTTDGYAWVPGEKFSQDRENQILKFRTIYENNAANPISGKGISLITQKDSTTADGEIITYLKAHTDDLILKAVNDVIGTDAKYSTYKDKNIFGLQNWNGSDKNYKVDWNTQLNDLVNAFDLLNKWQTVLTNYDANNKKLLAWSDKYVANSMFKPTDPKNINTKYNNGLAMCLPLEVKPLNPAADASILESKTYVKMDEDCSESIFSQLSHTFGLSDEDRLSDKDALKNLQNSIITKYYAWALSLSDTDFAPTNSDHQGNLGGEFKSGKYSENILSFNPYVNSLLNTFASSNAFSNSEKTYAIDTYINKDGDFDFSPYDDAIKSLFLTKQVLGSNLNLYSAFGPNGTGGLTFADYKNGLQSIWDNQLNTTVGSSNIAGVTNGYTDQIINYQMLKASIKYLSDNSYDQFMKRMQSLVVQPKDYSTWDKNAYIVWLTKNYAYNNNGFDLPDGDSTSGSWTDKDVKAEEWYGWHENYNNSFDSEYTQISGINTQNANKTYCSFDQYYQFGPMPIKGPASFDSMGFLGLQTTNTSINSTIKSALEDQFPASSSQQQNNLLRGSLYDFFDTNAVTSRANMKGIVAGLNQSSSIIAFAEYLNKRTNEFSAILNQLKNGGMDIPHMKSTLQESFDTVIQDNWFNGYNIAQESIGATTPTLELRNPKYPNTPIFYDDDSSNTPIGYRARIMQINYNDVKDVASLKAAVGDGLFNYLLVQQAMDSQTSTTTIYKATLKAILAAAYDGGKENVYDRRFNDQLGFSWVNDWKAKN